MREKEKKRKRTMRVRSHARQNRVFLRKKSIVLDALLYRKRTREYGGSQMNAVEFVSHAHLHTDRNIITLAKGKRDDGR